MYFKIPARDLPLLRQVVRSGILLVLLQHFGELPSAYKIASELGMDRRTVVRHLNDLTNLGFIRRIPEENIFVFTEPLGEEQQRLLEILTPALPPARPPAGPPA